MHMGWRTFMSDALNQGRHLTQLKPLRKKHFGNEWG